VRRIEREGGRAGEDVFDGLHLAEVNRRIGKSQDDWRYGKVVGDFMFLAKLQRLHQVKTLHDDLRAATGEEAAREHHAINMIEGQEDQCNVVDLCAQGCSKLEVIDCQIAVRQHG